MRRISSLSYPFLLIVSLVLATGFSCLGQSAGLYVLQLESPAHLRDFFRYSPDRIPFVSAHRGGPLPGYPENCLATFENTLRHTWAILEIDPRYTKDSTIVLMHDPTLERTTTGHGQVADYTLAELRQLRLKDTEGHITDYTIPTLGEALEWAKGKTVVVVDQKNVPMEARVAEIRKHGAEANALVMAYTYEDAKLAYSLNPDVMMEVFIADQKAADAFEKMGVPWGNTVAFVTHMRPKDPGIFQYLHTQGTLAIVGSSRTIDKDHTEKKLSKRELDKGYLAIIASGADIIEADLAIEAGAAVMKRSEIKGSKKRFFKILP